MVVAAISMTNVAAPIIERSPSKSDRLAIWHSRCKAHHDHRHQHLPLQAAAQEAEHRKGETMNVLRVIIISAALAPFLVECSQPQAPADEPGLCFQQPACAG